MSLVRGPLVRRDPAQWVLPEMKGS